MTDYFKTPRHDAAEARVIEAFSLIIAARNVMTIWEFERFIAEHIAGLGGAGFVRSIGDALIIATSRTDTEAIGNRRA